MAIFQDNFTGTNDDLISARTGWAAGPTFSDDPVYALSESF